jgi:hypothetical protein
MKKLLLALLLLNGVTAYGEDLATKLDELISHQIKLTQLLLQTSITSLIPGTQFLIVDMRLPGWGPITLLLIVTWKLNKWG